MVTFDSPLPTGEDPTVDLIVALERRSQPGRWIPNTERHAWDPSHPEKHTELLTGGPDQLRRIRARAIRLAKGENKSTATPPLCSFNLEAFGLMFVEPGTNVTDALLALWENGAADLRLRLTPDPAGVSAPIKVADLQRAVDRLDRAARHLRTALNHNDDHARVRTELQKLWSDFVASDEGRASKAQLAAGIATGATLHVTGDGGISTAAGITLKNPRSYGDAQG